MESQTLPKPSFQPLAADVTHAETRSLARRNRGLRAAPDPATWSIVLAGGEGERLRWLTERWLGVRLPKQYCTFVGHRSMLQHTLDRAVQLTGTERTLVVVAKQHAPAIWEHLPQAYWSQTILQPRNCGTAPGILLPLSHIRVKDPGAVVVILPSDHFVFPEAAFVTAVERVARAAHRLPDKLVLLGARAEGPETQYGWIQPGITVDRVEGHPVRTVTSFREKPDLLEAQRLLAAGGLWNTMVMAVRVNTLWDLASGCLPEMVSAFEGLAPHHGTWQQLQVLDRIYQSLPSADFSTHLVQRVPASAVVVELRDASWSDWGTAERIVDTLRRIGKRPWFAAVPQSGFCSAPLPETRISGVAMTAPDVRPRSVRAWPGLATCLQNPEG